MAKYVKITARSNWKDAAQYGLSEVRFLYTPVWAREPDPAPAATDVDVDNVTLSWRAGREAALHKLYLSTSRRAVEDGTAPVQTVSQTSYDTGEVQLGQTYYWKIIEANDAETPTSWEGDVWDFSTRQYLVVDNFESYNDDYENFNRIFQVWIDGVGYTQPEPGRLGNGSGALVGTDEAPWVEQTIVHSGRQSMPLTYNNTATPFYSEATRTFDSTEDWAKSGIRALTLWFYGDPNNKVTDQMYVKINGSKVPYDGDVYSITRTAWKEWNVNLGAFAGVDFGNVTEVSVGLERTGVVGGSGIVYFDDMRLNPARCLPSLLKPDADLNSDCEVDLADFEIMANQWRTSGHLVTPEQPSTASLVAHYEFEGTANDSAGTNNGVTTGGPTYVEGVVGQAINFDGFNDYMFAVGPFELPEYTMTTWFRSDGGTGNRDLLSAYSPGVLHGILLELQGAGTLRFLHRCPLGSNAAEDNSNVYSSGTYDDGDWHHAGMVMSGTEITLYVDGENEGSVPAASAFGPADALGLAIGILDNERTPARLFVGPMDDVRVYAGALSHAEVARLAGRTEPFSVSFDLNVYGSVGFEDIEALADEWLDEQLWPAP
ncbi:MAG: LamG domain-containing protein [Phycisphaerales bacterium]|nr:MAG: LamG domain-containing protein [Phycisphaerales bacterium]